MFDYEDETDEYTDSDLEAIGQGQWNRDGVVWDDPDMLVEVDD